MIILLYGPDSFRANQKLKEIAENYKGKHKSGLNFRQFEWQPENLSELDEVLSAVSMFAEKKLVVIKNAGLAAGQAELIGLLEKKEADKNDDFIIVFLEGEQAEKNTLSVWLSKRAKLKEEFSLLSGIKFSNWVKREIEKTGGKISAGALQKLMGYVGSDLWQMQNEVSKLTSFKKNGSIEERDVDFLVRAKIDPNIFATVDALAARNKNLAFKLLHEHLSRGQSEIYILTMFIYQFRNLLLIKSLSENGVPFNLLAKKTGLHPFVVKKSFAQIKNFSLDILRKIYSRLLEIDLSIKRGRLEATLGLDLLVGEVAG